MSDIAFKLADDLAGRAIELAAKHDDPDLIDEVSKAIGAASQTAQEQYMTSVRFRRGIALGESHLADYIAKAATKSETADTADD